MRNVFLLVFISLVLYSCNILMQSQKNKISKAVSHKLEDKQDSELIQKPENKQSAVSVKKIKSRQKKPVKNLIKHKQSGKLSEESKDKQIDPLAEGPENKQNKLKAQAQQAKPKCSLSDRSQKKINSYIFSIADNFLNDEDIEELLEMHLSGIQKDWPNKCPQTCKAVNDYSVFAKSYPINISRDSCSQEEAEELYQINKVFSMKDSGKEAKKKAYKEASDWMFAVFIKPFIPFSKKLPKEAVEHRIKSACPSCSFYLDYSYKYTNNQLVLNVTARCGDRRTFFSKFKSDFFLVNHWKCVDN